MNRAGLRVDIDNIIDATEGLQRFKEILDRYNARCTIFVNMGKSIHYQTLLTDIGKTVRNISGKTSSSGLKISVMKKLGKKAFLQTLIFNPAIGRLGQGTLLQMLKDGNELGLHGGRNHTTWQRRGEKMSRRHLFNELSWGRQRFEELFAVQPSGFSSPGFVAPPDLEQSLYELGFVYHSDSCGEDKLLPQKRILFDIPVNIVGPETVPIVEYLFAQGQKTEQIAQQVITRFENIRDAGGTPVIYGHPSVEGKLLGEVFCAVVEKLISNGWRLLPLKEILNETCYTK